MWILLTYLLAAPACTTEPVVYAWAESMADDKRRHPHYQHDLFERSFPIVYREGEEQFALGKLTVVLMSSDIDARLINTAKSHGLGLSIVKRIAH